MTNSKWLYLTMQLHIFHYFISHKYDFFTSFQPHISQCEFIYCNYDSEILQLIFFIDIISTLYLRRWLSILQLSCNCNFSAKCITLYFTMWLYILQLWLFLIFLTLYCTKWLYILQLRLWYCNFMSCNVTVLHSFS